jgi:hypothetical protein
MGLLVGISRERAMPRIRNELHCALENFYKNNVNLVDVKITRKLKLLGFITYEFGGKWVITEEGINYLLCDSLDYHGHVSGPFSLGAFDQNSMP